MSVPVVGSLCSGYGGLDMGLALGLGTPVRVAWHVEYDGTNKKGELTGPKRLLAHRYPDIPNHGDVKTTDWNAVEPIDWLTAGYPCQPFSHAGLRKGTDDPRHLWPGVARAISVLRPRNVLLENVRGHVSLGLDAVLGDLAALGYDCRWGLVRAADAGAPHGRARIFIVATDARDGAEHGERTRSIPRRGDQGAPSDARRGQLSGAASARDGLLVSAQRGDRAAADAHGAGLDGRDPARRHVLPAGGAPADAQGDGWDEGWAESAGFLGGLHAAQRGRASAADPDSSRLERVGRVVPIKRHLDRRDSQDVSWGAYEPAIRRWERTLGRPAPRPTEPGRTGERLSPRFVEWMQGLDPGWVTDVPGLTRNEKLKLLGNGVVPQQAGLAVRLLRPEKVAA
jgi:DNA (cytosine-5)-methyltransferase 1